LFSSLLEEFKEQLNNVLSNQTLSSSNTLDQLLQPLQGDQRPGALYALNSVLASYCHNCFVVTESKIKTLPLSLSHSPSGGAVAPPILSSLSLHHSAKRIEAGGLALVLVAFHFLSS